MKIPSCVSTSSDPKSNKSMLVRQPSYHKRLANFPTAFEVIQSTIEADGSGKCRVMGMVEAGRRGEIRTGRNKGRKNNGRTTKVETMGCDRVF